MGDQVEGGWRAEGDFWKGGHISGVGENLAQGDLPRIYKEDPSSD